MILQGETHFLVHERRLQAPSVPIPDQDAGKASGCGSRPPLPLLCPKRGLKDKGSWWLDGMVSRAPLPSLQRVPPAFAHPVPFPLQPSIEAVDGEPSTKKPAVQKKKSGDASVGTDSGLSPGPPADSK